LVAGKFLGNDFALNRLDLQANGQPIGKVYEFRNLTKLHFIVPIEFGVLKQEFPVTKRHYVSEFGFELLSYVA